MTDWKTTILPAYEIRKNRKQKTAFIEMLRGHYGETLTVEESKSFPHSRNIVLGNPDTAKIVFTAHYDTCARMFVPNFITPKNFLVYILYQLLIAAILLIPPYLLAWLAANLAQSLPTFAGLLLTEVTLFASFGAVLWLMIAGPANKHTANDNTSGVVTVLELADRMGFGEYAYVLFDHEEAGLLGASAFAQAHPQVKKNTLVVNFDCVSDGDNLLFAISKAAKDVEFCKNLAASAEKICRMRGKTAVVTSAATTVYPSDQAAFKKSVAVAALNRAPVIGLYMDKIHTSKDVVFQEENIETLLALTGAAAGEGWRMCGEEQEL